MIKMKSKQQGFTIVELMIATMIFGVMMLIVSGSIVAIGRQFYKGIISARTQEVTRNIADELSRNLQFSGSNPTRRVNGDVVSLCVDETEYIYRVGKKLVDPPGPTMPDEAFEGIVRFDSCGSGSPPAWPPTTIPSGGTELLGKNMRIVRLDISDDGTGRAWTVDIKVAFGDSDLLDGARENCVSGRAGSQFCATSEIKITVFKRL